MLRRAAVVLGALVLLAPSLPEEDLAEAGQVLHRLLELNAAARLQTPEAQDLLTGEALSHWTTDTVGPIDGTPDRLLSISARSVVARVPVALGGETQDLYFYLVRRGYDPENPVSGSWKVSSVRSLAMLGLYLEILDMNPAEIAVTPRGPYLVKNARLTVLSDGELRSWFAEHSKELERLILLIVEDGEERYGVGSIVSSSSPVIASLIGLGLSSAKRLPNGVEFIVGGLLDNTVGFLHLSSGSPPGISPEEYIWVEELGGGWFLFRTT